MIRLQEVCKSFHGTAVLQGLSLEVASGELGGLIGPNGAGKSTALRILTGQLLADSGSVELGGFDLLRQPLQARQRLGYVPQGGGVEPFLTGEEVLRFVADLRGIQAEPLVPQLLEQFSLSHAGHRLTREYSEGMQRRLAIAAALIGELLDRKVIQWVFGVAFIQVLPIFVKKSGNELLHKGISIPRRVWDGLGRPLSLGCASNFYIYIYIYIYTSE